MCGAYGEVWVCACMVLVCVLFVCGGIDTFVVDSVSDPAAAGVDTGCAGTILEFEIFCDDPCAWLGFITL